MEKSVSQRQLVFICGSHRSGTSMLFNVLKNHPRVAGTPDLPDDPHPELHFFDAVYAYRNCPLFDVKRRALERYLPAVVSRRGTKAGAEYQRAIANASRAREMFSLTARTLVLKDEYDVLVEKTPVNIFFVPIMRRIFPEAIFVFLLRDGREVCASAYAQWRSIGATPISLAARWGATLSAYERFLRRHPHVFLKYEDVTSRPSSSFRDLFHSLGLEFHEEFTNIPSTSSFSAEVSRPGICASSHYYDFFPEGERGVLEGLMRDGLVRYGYEPEFTDAHVPLRERAEFLKCYSKHKAFFALGRWGVRCLK